ncbi:MAG: AraC family transcriptional regulator [Hydrogeniiclostridium sp.]
MNTFYESLTHADPSFPVIFHLDVFSATRGSTEAAHWHEGIEFLFCVEGEAQVLSDMKKCLMKAGNLLVIHSGAIHCISPVSGKECRYYCLIVEPALLAECAFPIEDIPLDTVLHDLEMTGYFQQIISEMEEKKKYYKEAVRGEILLMFTRLCRVSEENGRQPASQPDMVKKVILYLRENFRKKITMDEICNHVGFSKYYVCHMFKSATGRSVMEYVLYLRCSYARHLLETGEYNISESARQSGFSDVSYFAKMFKRQIGRLPSEIRVESLAERRRVEEI